MNARFLGTNLSNDLGARPLNVCVCGACNTGSHVRNNLKESLCSHDLIALDSSYSNLWSCLFNLQHSDDHFGKEGRRLVSLADIYL
jgi:hypothetical protein